MVRLVKHCGVCGEVVGAVEVFVTWRLSVGYCGNFLGRRGGRMKDVALWFVYGEG